MPTKQEAPGVEMQFIESNIDPEELRRRAMQRLLDITSGDGLTFQLRRLGGVLYCSTTCATFDLVNFTRSAEDKPHLGGCATPENRAAPAVYSPYGNGTGGFQRSLPTLVRIGEGRELKSLRETQVWQEFYEPYEITDHLRAMFYADGELIGYLAAVRRGGDHFTLAEKDAANRLLPQIYDDLQLAWSAERALRDDDSLHLVLDERWNVVFASQSASVWLTARRRELLKTLGQSSERHLIDGMHVATTRLNSCPGGLFYASLTMVAPIPQARWELSETQQRIVDMATKGFTNAEIGLMLGLSPGAVKYHLNAALSYLGVRSRMALVNSVPGMQDS